MAKSFHSLALAAQSKRWDALMAMKLTPVEARALTRRLPDLMASRRHMARIADARVSLRGEVR
jgi:hypothetical protein